MGTSPRLLPIALAVLLGVMREPGRPPGAGAMASNAVSTVRCPEPGCGGWGSRVKEKLYKCDSHGGTFSYCSQHRKYLLDRDEAATHKRC